VINSPFSVFITDPVHRLQLEDSRGSAFYQTTTYSGAIFDERSFKIEVPPHRGSRSAFDQFTVVMHASSHGYWHGKDKMLFKKGDQCLIKPIPSDFYPVDWALGLKEIVDVVEERDTLVKHSVLFDKGEMTANETSSLGQPIKEECSPSSRTPSTIRRVREENVTEEQAATLDDGGVVFLPHPQQASRPCNVMKAVTRKSASNSWYWPNPDTGAEVALQNIIHEVEDLTCCVNTPGAPCCDTSYPNLCLCDDINNQDDFLRCLGYCKPGHVTNMQCEGKENGTPCSKDCTAPDCAESKCCNGCCKRGNVLARLGCTGTAK